MMGMWMITRLGIVSSEILDILERSENIQSGQVGKRSIRSDVPLTPSYTLVGWMLVRANPLSVDEGVDWTFSGNLSRESANPGRRGRRPHGGHQFPMSSAFP
jgi:hypothetical protein